MFKGGEDSVFNRRPAGSRLDERPPQTSEEEAKAGVKDWKITTAATPPTEPECTKYESSRSEIAVTKLSINVSDS